MKFQPGDKILLRGNHPYRYIRATVVSYMYFQGYMEERYNIRFDKEPTVVQCCSEWMTWDVIEYMKNKRISGKK